MGEASENYSGSKKACSRYNLRIDLIEMTRTFKQNVEIKNKNESIFDSQQNFEFISKFLVVYLVKK